VLECLHHFVGPIELLVIGKAFQRLQDLGRGVLGTGHIEQLITVGRIIDTLEMALYFGGVG
jgi:hypothetical protein